MHSVIFISIRSVEGFFSINRGGGKMLKFTALVVGGETAVVFFLIIYGLRSLGNNEINYDNTCKPDVSVNGWNSFSK